MRFVDTHINVLVQPLSNSPDALVIVPLLEGFQWLQANELPELVELSNGETVRFLSASQPHCASTPLARLFNTQYLDHTHPLRRSACLE